MPVNFKYAMVAINGKPVLVDQKKFDDASKALREALLKIEGLTAAALQNGYALQTPEGMKPLILGTANDFSKWVSAKMTGGEFDLQKSIGTLPEPFKTGLAALTTTVIAALELVMPLWLAALIVTVVYAAVAGVLALRGRDKIKEAAPPVPEQTQESVKEDVQWAKTRAKSGRG